MRQCKQCGEKVEGDWILCPHCNGELVELDSSDTYAEEERTRKMRVDETDAPESLPQGIRVLLEVVDGPARGMEYEVKKGRITVGRGDADLIIRDPKVSRKHFALEIWSRDIAYIQDLASTNGTYLNGVKITKTRLKHGDEIQVGDSRLKFKIKVVD